MGSLQTVNFLFLVSEEREKYNDIKIKYQNLANESSRDFSSKYSSYFSDIVQIHDKCPEIMWGYVNKAIETSIRDLISIGVNDIDDKEFVDKYLSDKFTWEKDWHEIDDKYNEIILNAEQLDAYRTSRRENRGKLIGFGFGVKGAAKGIAGAAVANMAIGAVHGTFNLIGKGFTAVGNMFKKDALFKDETTKPHLVNSIYRAVFSVHSAYVDAVNDRCNFKITGFRKKDECEKANRLYDNIVKGRVVGGDVKNLLVEALTLDPYNPLYYEYWLKSFGDTDGLLEKASCHFGVDVVTSKKKELVSSKLGMLKFGTVDECNQSEKVFEEYVKSLGCVDVSEARKQVLVCIEKTKNEAFIENLATYKITDKTALDSVVSGMVNYSASIGYTISDDDVKEKINRYIVELKTVDGKICSNIEEADLKRKQISIEAEIKARTVDGNVCNSLVEADHQRSVRKVSFILGVCIVFCPIVGLITFRKGYSALAKVLSVLWIVAAIAIIFSSPDRNVENKLGAVSDNVAVSVKLEPTPDKVIDNKIVTPSNAVVEDKPVSTDIGPIQPSFDCGKATTVAESLICSDKKLADADLKLSVTYNEALGRVKNGEELKMEQTLWVKNRRDVCGDISSMLQVYSERILELQK